MNRKTRIVLYSVGGLAFITLAIGAVMMAMLAKGLSGSWPWELRTPIEYRIPDGYQGWVRIRWADAGASPLRKSGRYLVVAVDSKGQAVTSSRVQDGWATDKYLYISGSQERQLQDTGWCKGGMIWGSQFKYGMNAVTQDGKEVYRPSSTNVEEEFFVGPEELYRKTADPQGNLHPCP